jgi:hypothetical protein
VSIATYSELKSAISSWLDRDDLDDRVDDFIRLTETLLNLSLRARVNTTVTTATLDSSAATVDIPADYLELIQMQVTSIEGVATREYAPLQPVSFFTLRQQGNTAGGMPGYFAQRPDGSAWDLWPVDGDCTVSLWYFAKVGPLSADAPTNAVLTNQPDLYLCGAIAQAENYLKLAPNERGPWAQTFASLVESLNRDRRTAELSGGTLQTRAAY